MPRAWFAGSLALALCWASLAYAQDPPALEAPADDSQAAKPATPPPKTATPAPKPAAPSTKPASPSPKQDGSTPSATPPATRANPPASPGSQVRPMLVIPGVTTPSSRPPVTSRPAVPQASRSSGTVGSPPTATGPALAAPAPGRSPFGQGAGQPGSRGVSGPAGQPIPMTIEPLDDEPLPDRNAMPGRSSPPPGSQARRRPGGSPSATRPRTNDSSEEDPSPATSGRSRPAPRPFPGILGRLFPPAPGSSPVRGESRSSSASARLKEQEKEKEKEKADEDRSEPQGDAAIKRKIEKQIRDTLGDRVRSVEVRVSGKNVLVVAQATRFWQKRLVRRSLETLPGLAGYRARIQLDD
jgi:hypothetical protein